MQYTDRGYRRPDSLGFLLYPRASRMHRAQLSHTSLLPNSPTMTVLVELRISHYPKANKRHSAQLTHHTSSTSNSPTITSLEPSNLQDIAYELGGGGAFLQKWPIFFWNFFNYFLFF